MLLKALKKLETKELIVEKARSNIKCLNIYVNLVYNLFVYFLHKFFPLFFTTIKSTTTIAI